MENKRLKTKEKVMKKSMFLAIAALALLVSTNIQAQPAAQELAKASCQYFIALNHTNDGVVESAIINVMKLKLVYPGGDYSKCIRKLEELTESGSTRLLRQKAYIAANFLKNPERFNWIESGLYDEISKFFDKYCERLAAQFQKSDSTLVVTANK